MGEIRVRIRPMLTVTRMVMVMMGICRQGLQWSK